MIQKTFFLLLTIIGSSSCVAHKDIVYFQGEKATQHKIKEINNQPYRLHVDDVLYINLKAANEDLMSVFKNNSNTQNSGQVTEGSTYFSGYTIDKQGFIVLPYLGRLNVLGYTTDEVSDKIKVELLSYIRNTDEVFVSVKLAGFKYTILGEVGSTGTKILYQNSVNIVEAIANAGDIKITGNRKNVEIIRNELDGVKKYTVDLTNMQVFDSEVFYLQPNDIINVPPLKQKTYGTGTNGMQTLTTVISAFSLVTTTILLIKNL